MAAHESAVATWTDLRVRRWNGQHETSLVNGIKQKVMGHFPSEADVSGAALAKEAAEHELQQTLMATNRERQAIDGNRWLRRREAERGASAKGR